MRLCRDFTGVVYAPGGDPVNLFSNKDVAACFLFFDRARFNVYEKPGVSILRILEEHSIAERRTSHLRELPAHHRDQARRQDPGQTPQRQHAHSLEIGGCAIGQLDLVTAFQYCS
ncbi:MAG TPA: hypothetical protein VMT20_11035 [Terriglobia bacterium]|nr:hypothetical protein [Terriglobia bacterium]